MFLRSSALAAASALVANAFMIPSTVTLPEIKGDGLDAISKLGIVPPSDGGSTVFTIDLECLDCHFESPLSSKIEKIESPFPNTLTLNFKVGEHGRAFLVNDAPMLRIDPDLRIIPSLLEARQHALPKINNHYVPVDGSLRPMSYSMNIQRTPVTDDDPDFSLINVHLAIYGFEDEWVSLNPVTIRMLNHEDYGLSILDAVVEDPLLPSDNPLPAISHSVESQACPTRGPFSFFCRANAIIKDKLSHIRLPQFHNGCHGKHHNRVSPEPYDYTWEYYEVDLEQEGEDFSDYWLLGDTDMEAQDYENPHFYSFEFYEEQSGFERLTNAVRSFITGFLIPVFIGIMAGMTASLLGMVVGTLIGWLWVKLVRGGKRGNASQRLRERELAVEATEEDEKMGLVAHVDVEEQEPPPVYVEKE